VIPALMAEQGIPFFEWPTTLPHSKNAGEIIVPSPILRYASPPTLAAAPIWGGRIHLLPSRHSRANG
jgi:hypothetical protein